MRRKLSLLLIGLAAVAALGLAITALGARAGSAAAEPVPPKAVLACADCHSMEKEVTSWANSVHKDLTCLECHTEGDVQWVRHEFLEKNEDMAAHQKGQIQTIHLKTYNERCVTCHEEQMEYLKKDLVPPPLLQTTVRKGVNIPMDVRAMHDKHLNAKEPMDCVACHLSEVHGLTLSAEGRKDAQHKLCLDCHQQKQVTIKVEGDGDVSCVACHIDKAAITPADHRDAAAWKSSHGKATETQSCGSCHLSSSAGPHNSALANPAAFPTQQQGDVCLSCHAGMAMPHPDSFMARHGKEALTAKEGTCQTCHSPQQGAAYTPDHAGPKYCTECHLQPMPHPADYLKAHGTEALKAPVTCAACHSSKNPVNPRASHAAQNYCSACHDSYQHPQGWVAGHGTQVMDSCATCHSVKEDQGSHNSCAACHTSSGSWHPKMWFVTHGKQVKAEGEASCAKCHNEVEPSCSKCHTGR